MTLESSNGLDQILAVLKSLQSSIDNPNYRSPRFRREKAIQTLRINQLQLLMRSLILKISNLEKTLNNLPKKPPAISSRSSSLSYRLDDNTFINNLAFKIARRERTLSPSRFQVTDSKVSQLRREFRSALRQQTINLNTLSDSITNSVCENIVGESYSRWDSTSRYYPTIIFFFKEETDSNKIRRCQIKLRLKEKNEDISEVTIKTLKSAFNSLGSLSFTYGITRANYVSTDKRYKTTVFCDSRQDAEHVLTTLCNLVGDTYEARNLSITIERQRENTIKRTRVLSGTGLNSVDYGISFKVSLHRCVLLINGLEKPYLIGRKD